MKLYIDKEVVGKSLPESYKVPERFKIFRYAEIRKKQREPEGWFIVRFQLRHMDVKKNQWFSLLPMLVLVRFKGFRSKYWLMDEASNTCMGVYRWQTEEDAIRYAQSIAMKFMRMRSVEGSVSYQVGKGSQPICEF